MSGNRQGGEGKVRPSRSLEKPTSPFNTPGGRSPSLKEMIWGRLGSGASRIHLGARTGRAYRQQTTSANSRHSEWYRDMVPGMIPIVLLGSTVYLGLQLARAKFSHEKQVTEARERVSQLEARLMHLESQIGNVSVERVATEEKPTKKSWWW